MQIEEGRRGEEQARAFLRTQGYTLLEANYRDRHGEIDIVARRSDELVFAEVKTWRSIPFEEIGFSVDAQKRRTIVRESKRYLFEHPQYGNMCIRYDLIFIEPETGRVEHIPDAFTENGAA